MDLKVDKNLPITLKLADKFGNETGQLDEKAIFENSDESLSSLEVSETENKAKVKPSGKLGQGKITARGKSGGKDLSGSLDINFIAGDAVSLEIVAGEPESQEEKPAEEQPQEPVQEQPVEQN